MRTRFRKPLLYPLSYGGRAETLCRAPHAKEAADAASFGSKAGRLQWAIAAAGLSRSFGRNVFAAGSRATEVTLVAMATKPPTWKACATPAAAAARADPGGARLDRRSSGAARRSRGQRGAGCVLPGAAAARSNPRRGRSRRSQGRTRACARAGEEAELVRPHQSGRLLPGLALACSARVPRAGRN